MKILSLFGYNSDLQIQLNQLRPKLYRLAYSWCHNPALAEDLVQETLIKALKNNAQLRDPTVLKGWLYSILANCLRDHYRQYREMLDIDEIEDFHYVNETTPEDEHSQSQIVIQVRKAVAKLPAGQRQVLTLVDLEELSYIEVAAVLEIPIGTVMSRLCRARITMKLLLKELAPNNTAQSNPLRSVK